MSYFNSITTPSSFRARFTEEGAKTFSDLHYVPASQWGRDHLFACRVVRRGAQPNILPILSSHSVAADTQAPTEIRSFIDGPTPAQLAQTERALVHSCGVSLGQVWAALAMLTGPQRRRTLDDKASQSQADDDVEPRPKRDTQQIHRDGFTDSTTVRVGSSSPLDESSQSAHSADYMDVESQRLVSAPENHTVRLISCAIRHVLYHASAQSPMAESGVVEFRDDQARLAALVPGDPAQNSLLAVDDGGLCFRQDIVPGVFEVRKNRVAILEAKKQFQCIRDNIPIISDECFAQMTCEALVARLADPLQELGESVIVINATRHYVCFLQFDISEDYINDFASPAPATFLRVSSTPWFNLESRNGRKHVVANICGLVRRVKGEEELL